MNDLLTVTEAAALLGRHVSGIRAACERGELRAEKLGQQWAIRPADLDTWAGRERRKPGPKTTRKDETK